MGFSGRSTRTCRDRDGQSLALKGHLAQHVSKEVIDLEQVQFQIRQFLLIGLQVRGSLRLFWLGNKAVQQRPWPRTPSAPGPDYQARPTSEQCFDLLSTHNEKKSQIRFLGLKEDAKTPSFVLASTSLGRMG